MKKQLVFIVIIALLAYSPFAYAGVIETLNNIQSVLTAKILPIVAILGLVFAAFSFAAGSQNARAHVSLAVIGALIGFGAPAIVNFLKGLIQ